MTHARSRVEHPWSQRRIDERASFELIRYGNCWEDARILCEALAPGPNARILSICSAGDNVLALLSEGAEVVAADLSLAQLACLELRCAAFASLSYEETLAFLGLSPHPDRRAALQELLPALSPKARAFWTSSSSAIDDGLIQTGRFEAYLRMFRRWMLPLVHDRKSIERLLEARNATERERFYDESWNTRRWRLLFRVFFSRFVMGRLGRDPEFFRFAEGRIAEPLLARARHAVTTLPPEDNPYLEFILTGCFARALPPYLQPHRFDAIRQGLSRLTLYHGSVERAARTHGGEAFHGFNLSDIFEYLSPQATREIYAELLEHAAPDARLIYWNAFVPRTAPEDLADRVESLTPLAERLLAKDRAFFFQRLVLEQVRAEPPRGGSRRSSRSR